MQSLRKRIDSQPGGMAKFMDYLKTFGEFKAMEHYQIKSYDAFKRLVDGKNNGHSLNLHPGFGNDGNSELAENLLTAFENRIDHLKSIIENQKEIIEEQKRKLEYLKGQHAMRIEPKIISLYKKCQENGDV